MPTHRPEVAHFAGHLGAVGRAVDDWLASDMPDALTSDVDWQGALSGPAPEHGIGAQATVDEYLRLILAHGTRLASPASWGWITTGPTTIPSVVAAGAMAVAPQRQTVSAFHHVEELSLERLASLCGLEPHMRGVYSSGGSTANLVALGAARQHALEQVGFDASDRGLDGRRGSCPWLSLPRPAPRTPVPSTRCVRPATWRTPTAPGSMSTAPTACPGSSTSGWPRCTTDSSWPTR